MSDDKHRQVGMSKRQLEEKARWMLLRNPPTDPIEMAKRFVDVMTTLIDLNNSAIAASLGAGDDDKPHH